MGRKAEMIPWYMKPINPSPIVSGAILAAAAAFAYTAATSVGRWYDRVVPGIVEKAEIAKLTADTVLNGDDEE